MANVTEFQTNQTVRMGIQERVMISAVTTLPCCLFFSVNVVMLFVLRSKPVFRETSRYILLYNLLFADTVQMLLGQALFILSACRILLTYPMCGFLVIIALLTNEISPLILVVMSLERYVAVCHPFRHATVVSMRNTGMALLVVWAFSSLNVLIRALLLLQFPFQDLDSLQMTKFCDIISMFLVPASDQYDKAYTYFVFVLAGVAIISSYIGVTLAARSASTDKASACKARNTLLLHMVQLGLSLCSTMFNSIIISIAAVVKWVVFVRLQFIFYVLIIISPRCLSSLIYGLRDQTISPVFMYHLCCRMKVSVVAEKEYQTNK